MLLCLKFEELSDALYLERTLKENFKNRKHRINILGRVLVQTKLLYNSQGTLFFFYVEGINFPVYLIGLLILVINVLFWQNLLAYLIGGLLFSSFLLWSWLPYYLGCLALIKKLKIEKPKRVISQRAMVELMKNEEANYNGAN